MTHDPNPWTQHTNERRELIAAVNAVGEWRPLRPYALRLFAAGLPAAVCLWMVTIEARQRVWEHPQGRGYRLGVLRRQLARMDGIEQIPEQALFAAVDFDSLEELDAEPPA